MIKSIPSNIPASIRNRLLNYAKAKNIEFQYVLGRYANERFLYRLSISPYNPQFILKGAALFTIWTGNQHRATKDLDFLGFGEPDTDRFLTIFKEICQIEAPDGISFLVNDLKIENVREDEHYEGLRVTFSALLGVAIANRYGIWRCNNSL